MPSSSSSDQTFNVIMQSDHASDPASCVPLHPRASQPRYDDEVRVWLSSEFVDSTEHFRFDPADAIYEAARWPLGLTPGRDKVEQIAMAGMCDGDFDWQVRCALNLPQRYSGLRFGSPPRRDRANLWIRHVGHWNGEQQRFTDVVAGLARLPRARHPSYAFGASYALTPFAVIGQTWCRPGPAHPAFIVDTTIAFFYTFETLVQECLIVDALKAGATALDLIAGYEHRYSRVSGQPNLLLDDPRTFKLARHGSAAIDWDGLQATPQNATAGTASAGWEARSSREFLFVSRFQTHLMVAIAAACHGLANFASGLFSSPLVKTLDMAPGIDALAPHWLGHVTRSYDHAAASADLLKSLAEFYQQDLSSDQLRGMPIPRYRRPSNPVENSIANPPPFLRGCTAADAFDAYRWNLFDASLDDTSVMEWSREAIGRVENG